MIRNRVVDYAAKDLQKQYYTEYGYVCSNNLRIHIEGKYILVHE